MEIFSDLINWDNLLAKSMDFKKNKPFRFAFVEEFFHRDFYEKLYETYPKIDKTWGINSDHSKFQYYKTWNCRPTSEPVMDGDDPTLSEYWNKLKRYVMSKEFIENFKKFSGVDVGKTKHLLFMGYKKGGFQLPHIHNVGPSTLILMLYFSKNWPKGDPGGTYMAKEEDESTIIFEPYNLDNSMALFQDGPKAAHGVRYISKDIIRQGFQITLEGYSSTSGWSGDKKEK